MKYYSWNSDKNKELIEERQISFEDIVFYISKGFLLDTIKNPNQIKYKDQKIFIVNVEGYAYLVPFVESEDELFLKTIIPSRKATKFYLGGKKE